MFNQLFSWLLDQGLSVNLSNNIVFISKILLILVSSILANFIAKKVILGAVKSIIKRTKNTWDDIFVKQKVFEKLSHIAPGWVIYHGVRILFFESDMFIEWIQRIAVSYMILAGLVVINSLLSAVLDIYQRFEVSKRKPIKGYIQAVKIVCLFLCLIFIVSVLVDKSPWRLLSVLGGLTAVLMLVFKDTILGFVASIQLISNNMIARGDWIEMPKYGADGDVIDVSIHTVKVQNWDKTVTTIPTYALISDAFKNWKGMSESGGRRIKRSIMIDVQSISFCTDEMLQRFTKFDYIKEYINNKLTKLKEYNKEKNIDESVLVNGRRLTNVGTFRAYVEQYLKAHPKIHNDMTFLVRQLAPTEYGLPIEIYVFSNDQVWAHYEAIQADIFDHILAVIPEFDLRVFQSPSGANFEKLLK